MENNKSRRNYFSLHYSNAVKKLSLDKNGKSNSFLPSNGQVVHTFFLTCAHILFKYLLLPYRFVTEEREISVYLLSQNAGMQSKNSQIDDNSLAFFLRHGGEV